MRPPVSIRRAVSADLDTLNTIALAAKAYWGYPPRVLQTWLAELTVTVEALAVTHTLVATNSDAGVIGFGQLDPGVTPWDLSALWVAPDSMRRGVGTQLLDALLRLAREAGEDVVHIDADPHAAAFYRARGARARGEIAAPIPGQPDRVRPQLELATADSADRDGVEQAD